MRVAHRLAMLVLVGSTLTGCAGAPDESSGKGATAAGFPVEATSCGHVSTVKAPPRAAITLNQGATEVALALGLEQRLVGTAYLDDAVAPRLADAYAKVKVLATEYPSHEAVLAQEPDFVYGSYASAFADESAGTRDELQGLGIGSYLSPFGCPDARDRAEVGFESVWQEIHAVADVFGVPERAAGIESDQRATVEELARVGAGRGTRVFWYDSGDKTALAGAGEGGPQVILDAVGATNVFGGLDGGWADVSWERVVKAEPDVIVVADASWSSAAEKIAHLRKDPVLKRLRAVRDDRFITVAYSESTPGVRLVDGAQQVSDGLIALDRR